MDFLEDVGCVFYPKIFYASFIVAPCKSAIGKMTHANLSSTAFLPTPLGNFMQNELPITSGCSITNDNIALPPYLT